MEKVVKLQLFIYLSYLFFLTKIGTVNSKIEKIGKKPFGNRINLQQCKPLSFIIRMVKQHLKAVLGSAFASTSSCMPMSPVSLWIRTITHSFALRSNAFTAPTLDIAEKVFCI
jgi:hypothetical protein